MSREKVKDSFLVGMSYTLLSAVGISLIGLFGKLGEEVFSLTALIFWRFFAGFFICLLVVWGMGALKKGISAAHIKMHILRVIFVLGAQYSFYYYIQTGNLLNGTMLLNTGPLFIPFIEWLALKKKVGASSWVAVFISFLGVICILQPDREIFSLTSGVGILSGICQGMSQVVFGINSKEERSDLGVLYLMFLGALCSLWPYLIEESIHVGERGAFWPSLLLVIGLGLASVFNQMARAVAYQHGSPSRFAVFLYLAVILAGFWDWLVFNKPPNLLSLIGTGLVIVGGVAKVYLRASILRRTKP